MQFKFVARKTHKWLSLLIGVQMLIWIISGLYMTAVDISYIHGDHIAAAAKPAPLSAHPITPLPAGLISQYGYVSSIKLKHRLTTPVYQITTTKGEVLINAITGDELAELNESEVRQVAQQVYLGDSAIRDVQRLDRYPAEIGGRNQPVWQVNYDHWLNETLYIAVDDGRLLRKRSDLWRWFDFLWMLHIMDYDTREDINTPLLTIAASLGLLMALAGVVLVIFRFKTNVKVEGAKS